MRTNVENFVEWRLKPLPQKAWNSNFDQLSPVEVNINILQIFDTIFIMYMSLQSNDFLGTAMIEMKNIVASVVSELCRQ